MNQIRECRYVPIRCIHGNDRVIALSALALLLSSLLLSVPATSVRATASGQQAIPCMPLPAMHRSFRLCILFLLFALYDHQIYIQFQNLTTFYKIIIYPQTAAQQKSDKISVHRSICHILMMPTNCFVLRTFTILPVIRISWDFHPTLYAHVRADLRSCIHL